MKNKYPFLLTLLLVSLFSIVANAATYTVTKIADTNDGVCNADCSFREAIAVANSTPADDIINFDSAIFATSQTITLGGTELTIDNNGTLTINGTAANRLKISGNNLSRVFTIASGATATINSLTVTGGRGISTNGGGINNAGTLTLNNVEVNGNSVIGGGNSNGGGISTNGILNLNNSSVINNSVGNSGGGLITFGTVNITNSTLSGNSAGSQGGAIRTATGSVNLINSTVTSNTAIFGSGIRAAAPLNFRNSIIAGNIATTGSGFDLSGFLPTSLNSQGFNLLGNVDGVISGDTTGNILNQGAGLAPLGFYGGETLTHALLSFSSAINGGNTATSPATDQRGATRIGTADIGAFELNNSANGGNFVAQLPNGFQNVTYNYVLCPSQGGFTYTVTNGTLPNGLSITDFTPAKTLINSPLGIVTLGGFPTQSGTFNFSINMDDTKFSNTTDYRLQLLVPNAASASVSGKVLTATGRGLANAVVTMTNQNGETISTRTSSFGYYRFDEVQSGETYIVSVASRRYQFASQVVNVSESLDGLNFMAQ